MKRKIQSREFRYLFHEFDMFYIALIGLNERVFDDGNVFNQIYIKDILTETWLLHFRNLYIFLFQEDGFIEDILAIKLFRNPAVWVANKPSPSEMIRKYRNKAKIMTSHLTYSLTRIEEEWDYKEVSGEIIEAFRIFIRLISREYEMNPNWVDDRIKWIEDQCREYKKNFGINRYNDPHITRFSSTNEISQPERLFVPFPKRKDRDTNKNLKQDK